MNLPFLHPARSPLRTLAAATALLLCLSLAACGDRPSQAGAPNAETKLGQKIREASDTARQKLATQNIKISNDSGTKAEISPTGDLLIGGETIAINDAQRSLLLQYREHMMKVTEIGIELGVQGANLGVRAAGEAIKGIFSGNTDQVEERINAEAKKLEENAREMCDQLPGMLALQQQLAASIPEFKPYAVMKQSDIDECRNGKVNLR